jgi:hypothetical protein
MFTVKHISSSGAETLYEATEVNYSPANQAPGADPSTFIPDTVWYTKPGTREICSIDRGMVFVTNETGATVARYNLPPDQLPHAA